MANDPKNPNPSGNKSPDQRGVGQSGYAGGRKDRDPALDRKIETENPSPAKRDQRDDDMAQPASDDRFTGRPGQPKRGNDAIEGDKSSVSDGSAKDVDDADDDDDLAIPRDSDKR